MPKPLHLLAAGPDCRHEAFAVSLQLLTITIVEVQVLRGSSREEAPKRVDSQPDVSCTLIYQRRVHFMADNLVSYWSVPLSTCFMQ